IFPETFYYICQEKTVVARMQSIPVFWEGEPESLPDGGWDWALKSSFEAAQAGQQANTLCALEIGISPPFRGQGLSRLVLKMMRELAQERGYSQLIAPVRTSQKHLYPLIPMEEYITWKDAAGLSLDPWLRTHQRMGARLVKVAAESMCIESTVENW